MAIRWGLLNCDSIITGLQIASIIIYWVSRGLRGGSVELYHKRYTNAPYSFPKAYIVWY